MSARTKSRYPVKWKTREGQSLMLEQMSDKHLTNAAALLERKTRETYGDNIAAGYSALGCLQGEMALYAVESELLTLERSHWADYLPEAYHCMVEELDRRECERAIEEKKEVWS